MKLAILSTAAITTQVHLVYSTSFKTDFLLETIKKRSKNDNNLNNLRDYGCYCFKDDQDFFSGKGPGLNKLDKLCKALTNCYKCNAHTFGSCDPVGYQNDVKMTKDGHFDCPNENSDFAEDQCNAGFCQCDQEFMSGVDGIHLMSLDEEIFNNNLDRSSKCVMSSLSIKEVAAKQIEKEMPPSAPMRGPPGIAALSQLERPTFKFGVGAPTFHDNDEDNVSNSGRSNLGLGISSLGRPLGLGSNNLLSNIDLDSLKNNLADVPDEDASEQGDSDYLYEDTKTESKIPETPSSPDSEMSNLPAFSGSRPTFTVTGPGGPSSIGRLGMGFASGNPRNFIIVPSDNVSECCGESPRWFPITFSEHKSCCENKSFNVLLSQCCDGKILATGSC